MKLVEDSEIPTTIDIDAIIKKVHQMRRKLDEEARAEAVGSFGAVSDIQELDLGSWKNIAYLGSGVLGVVHLMHNPKGEKFAVKIFNRQNYLQQSRLSESFSREFWALGKLSHPCIVPVYGFSGPTQASAGALVMKYMERGSLHDILEQVGRGEGRDIWTPTGISIIVCGIVLGLEFIHSRGFVHRDVKPANILIDGVGRSRIGDFGSSKFFESTTRWTGGVVGSVQYAAPELYGDPPYSSKIDVFAFGLILYEILVGQPVFKPTLSSHRVTCLAGERTRPELPATMRSEVQNLIGRCWSVEVNERPSFSEIWTALEGIEFRISEGVDSSAVLTYVSDIRSEVEASKAA
jgi:serine/threonine-protein kinase